MSLSAVDGARASELVPVALAHVLSSAGREPELAVRVEMQLMPRLARLAPVASTGASTGEDASTQVITGGTGGLGLLTARWLAQHAAAQALVLVSRSGVLASDMASDVEQLRQSGAQWLSARGDMSQVADGRSVLAQVRQGQRPRRPKRTGGCWAGPAGLGLGWAGAGAARGHCRGTGAAKIAFWPVKAQREFLSIQCPVRTGL